MSRKLQRLRIHNVDVGWRDSQDYAVWLGDVLGDEVPCLPLDIRGLVPYRYFGQAGQIDQSQAQHVRRVDLQVDRLPVDTLVAASDPSGFVFDLALDRSEVPKLLPAQVVEFGPFPCPATLADVCGM